MELFLPKKSVKKELDVGSGKRKVIFKVIGDHSECSAFLYVPYRKIIIIGDNLASDINNPPS